MSRMITNSPWKHVQKLITTQILCLRNTACTSMSNAECSASSSGPNKQKETKTYEKENCHYLTAYPASIFNRTTTSQNLCQTHTHSHTHTVIRATCGDVHLSLLTTESLWASTKQNARHWDTPPKTLKQAAQTTTCFRISYSQTYTLHAHQEQHAFKIDARHVEDIKVWSKRETTCAN